MTAAETDAVARYRKESWRLLAQVDVELERGDLEAASQALWDAAAHGLKAAAARRGWPHDTVHDQLYIPIRLIQEEGGADDLNTNAMMAHAFKRRDRAWLMPIFADDVAYCKGPIAELLRMLEAMN